MKKDPQCGTYVSTELSLKSRYHNEVLHFCSRQCQEKFLEAQASKSA
ncbi:MAG: YHS domain-containing protein [Acidobacteria bacterium]|nr:YHS domain-containing protein [Acidobacteriota bacterium]